MSKRKFIDFEIRERLAEKYIAQDTFHHVVIFERDLIDFYMKKSKIVLNNLPYIEMKIHIIN